jgi:spermidine synthase
VQVLLGLVVVGWGIQAIVTQSLLLREALVLMYGSEFAWGVVLFAWLSGVAVGAVVGGWWAERSSRAALWLVGVLFGLSVAAAVDLWVFRGARAWFGVEPGELLPLPTTLLAAMLFVSPVGALVGAAFPFASCLRVQTEPRASARADVCLPEGGSDETVLPLGAVYALESLGSLVGGAVFTFWAVENLAPIQAALISGAMTLACLGVVIWAVWRKLSSAVTLALCATLGLVIAVVAGARLERRLVERRWRDVAPGYELRAHAESKFQNLAVGQRAEQFTLYSNGVVTSDFPDPYTFVPLAHFWMCQHPDARKMLVLGGGAEGLLAEILLHDVEHVDYVEPDPRQIELIEPYLTDADRAALNDPRVSVHHQDGRRFIKDRDAVYDLVIARLPEPVSALNARFYTTEFYRELRAAAAPDSVLCMTAAAAPGELSALSAEYLASIRAMLERSFPEVVIGWGDPAHIFAATREGLVTTEAAVLASRYIERGVQSERFDPAWFAGATDWLDSAKLAERKAQLDGVSAPLVSTQMHPIIYLQRLELWERMTGGGVHGMISRLRLVRWYHVVALLMVLVVLTYLAGYLLRDRRARDLAEGGTSAAPRQWVFDGAIMMSVGSTGLVTMALSIVWLFAFQSRQGYVYQRIGWIIALFMAGLVLGCGVGDWWGRKRKSDAASLWRQLVAVDVLLAVLSLSVPVFLPLLDLLYGSKWFLIRVEAPLSAMVLLTGVLGGAAFAFAARLHNAITQRVGRTAGVIVGADHAGACLGALLSGILLVPVLGITVAALLLAGVKMGSAFLLLAGRRGSHAA